MSVYLNVPIHYERKETSITSETLPSKTKFYLEKMFSSVKDGTVVVKIVDVKSSS